MGCSSLFLTSFVYNGSGLIINVNKSGILQLVLVIHLVSIVAVHHIAIGLITD